MFNGSIVGVDCSFVINFPPLTETRNKNIFIFFQVMRMPSTLITKVDTQQQKKIIKKSKYVSNYAEEILNARHHDAIIWIKISLANAMKRGWIVDSENSLPLNI